MLKVQMEERSCTVYKKDITYKLRNGLNIYKSKHLESIFIKIINQQNKKHNFELFLQATLCGSKSIQQ